MVDESTFQELKLGDNIMKNISSGSRLADVALTCAIDICRAAAYVDVDLGENILPEIAADMAHEIKVRDHPSSVCER
jgi:hypothetical protein